MNVKIVIVAVAFVGLITGASVLYNNLSNQYAGDNLGVQQTQSSVEGSTSHETTTTPPSYSLAPDFTVTDEEGNKVKLSDFRGEPVVINFWATWCYYCKVEMPDFNTAFNKYPDVNFLMVNATDGFRETVSVAKEFIEDSGFDFDVYYDTERSAVNTYGVSSYPLTLFIDKDGNLIGHISGMTNLETLEKGIAMITEE